MFRKTTEQTDSVLRNPSTSSEDSDHSQENEPTVKREYLELLTFSSDSESLVDSIDNDAFRNIKAEPKSDDESICIPSIPGTNPTTNLSESESIDENDYETEWLDIKEESLDSCDTNNEMMLIIVSDKDKQTNNSKYDKSNSLESFDDPKTSNSTAHSIADSLGLKKCDFCSNYIKICLFNDHMKEHRQKYKEEYIKKHAKVECEYCGKKVGKTYYKHHLKMHTAPEEEKMLKCTICAKYVSTRYIFEHVKRVHDKLYIPAKAKVTEQQDSKEPVENKQCPLCDKEVKESELKLHVAKHKSPLKEYICDQCGKKFKYPSAFRTHRLTHTSELKYKCQFCPYQGLHQGLLKIHVRTHTGDYNYKCTECPAKFITKSNLSKHLMRHKGVYNFTCEVCEKGFYLKRDLDRHVINSHEGTRNQICDVCGKAFYHRDNLLSHQLKVHKRKAISRGRLPTYLKAKQKQLQDEEEID